MKNPILSTHASANVSPTYGFASTATILSTFEAKGWTVDKQTVAKVKSEERQGFQKHLISLKHADYDFIPGLSEANKSAPRLYLLNSHDGTASLRMFYGLVRIACLNGIIAGVMLKDFKAVHSASIIERLDTGIDYMSNGMPALFAQVESLASRSFSDASYKQLAKELVDLRLKNVKNIVSVNYESATKARRQSDVGSNDAFMAYNKIQEAIVRGGIQYSYLKEFKNEQGLIVDTKLVTTTTKRLSSIDSQVSLNRTAYDLALQYAA